MRGAAADAEVPLDRRLACGRRDGIERRRVERSHEFEAGLAPVDPDDAAGGRLEAGKLQPDLRAHFEVGVGFGREAGDREVQDFGIGDARAGLAQARGKVQDAALGASAFGRRQYGDMRFLQRAGSRGGSIRALMGQNG